ncbi:MAG: chitobiase/beta-hexosaminidase C-terminal domain-containing protein, partial [Fibrobacterota bacterium]|nr:chitobiase/beta-hexosaminidase C-terminal domain-containing protein [Fibrobacterota bacterium]
MTVTLLLLAAAMQAGAQTKRCDLVGRDTVISGVSNPFKRCLDLSGLNEKVITVPSNVTRIDNDGLSLCKGSLRLGGDADIVFVMDQSGSMGTNRAWVNTAVTPNDTIYYFNDDGCTDKGTSGTVNLRAFEAVGAATPVPFTYAITRLNSNTNCSSLSGDPYKVRATAVEKAIDYITSSGSPVSTVGFVGFAGTNRALQTPLTVNAANVATLKGKINIEEAGGTNYYDGINQAKTWLKDPGMIKTGKQVIVFISDGRPTTGGDALTLLDGTMPPIYSIYLAQKATADTAIMKQLSDGSGGKFHRVPGNEPDSVVKIVQRILNLILKEYQPQTAVVSNNTLAPVQSATAAMPVGFTLQPDGSWLMKLSDIIALKGSSSNLISIRTHFKETDGPGVDTQTINFTLQTTDSATSTTTNLAGKPFAVTCYDKSTLAIQNAAGLRPAFFTDADAAYRLRVRTTQVPLDSVTIPSRTALKLDSEKPVHKPPVVSADSMVFAGSNAFAVLTAAKTNSNGILESSLYDSLIVSWVHPRDAQDFASDAIPVRAAKKQALAWFSATNGGEAITQYLVDATQIYVVIKDQSADPRKAYTAVITSEKFGIDRETVTLTELAGSPGTLVGVIVKNDLSKARGDGFLQVSLGGDQFRVDYKDPVDGDSAFGTAGFDENVQEAPNLEFTDAAGSPLAPDAIWSPANGKLFLKYSDDYAYGRIPAKQVVLTLVNRKFGSILGTDHEKVTVNMESGSSGTRATWTGSIDLADVFPSVDSNGRAESRFRGEATILVTGHDNVGNSQTAAVSDFLIIAYPDSQASIQWRMDTTVTPKTNEGIVITIKDQTFTLDRKDTALVSIGCTRSGDSVSNFPAIEGPSATSGTYTSGTLIKDEGVPVLSDKVLSCLVTDQIRIRYVDPVYGTLTELLIDEVARPEANPSGRKFITSELVTITTTTPGAVIYFTLDGSTPIPGVSDRYSEPLRISVTTTLKAIAVKPGFKDSKVMTQTYTKEFAASRLEILDENGNAIPGGTLTGAATGIRIKLVTTQDNLRSATTFADARVSGDADSVVLGNSGSLGSALEFWEQVPLKHPYGKVSKNDTIEAIGTDTLIVRWVNPFDARDVAADTLIVKPAFIEAEVYFSSSQNGPKINQYPPGQDSIYIVVKTRPRDPNLTYTVTVTSVDGNDDLLVLKLTELSPGVFSAKAPVGTGSKDKADQIIQVAAAGDQLTAVFKDPVYLVDFRGNAGFAQQVQEFANLEFIDENGNIVPPTDFWNPTKGRVYIRFSDDWNPGISDSIQTKTVRFSLRNTKGEDSVSGDFETVNIKLKDSTASRGTWEGSLTLTDKAVGKNSNDTLETYYRGRLRATVTPHNNAGFSVSPDLTDEMLIAYPDQPAEIVIRDTSRDAVDRKTDKVEIIIRDQLFTKSGDATLNAEVGCSMSGDRVASVTLVWDGSAYVIKPPLDKGETFSTTLDKSDVQLLCRDSDILTVTYKDPVYLQPRTAEVRWSDETEARMYYASTKDGSTITSANDAVTKDFLIVVEGKSPSRDKIDTLNIILTTAQGELDTLRAVETGAFTGKFTVKADFLFRSADPTKGDKIVQGRITLANRINQVLLNGKTSISGKDLVADLSLISSYDRVAHAYIKDVDEDGRADHVYFVFDHKLPTLPASLEKVFWNHEGAGYSREGLSSMLSFLPGSDSTMVVADFSKVQFGANLTSVSAGKPAPFGLFPDDKIFGGQKPVLADSVGPVVVTAEKRPSNLQSYNVTITEKRFNPDTLVITVSEPLKTSTAFDDLFRFSKGCSEYSESVPLKLFSQPAVSADGLTWLVVVDNAPDAQTPLVKDCLFLDADGRYTDLLGSRPGRLGVPLTGENPKLVIREFRGFPPVAGLDANTPGFQVSTNDKRGDEAGIWSQPTGTAGAWEVVWIPPYGFKSIDPVGSLQVIANDFNNPASGERRPEVANPQPMPTNISAVQVVASG